MRRINQRKISLAKEPSKTVSRKQQINNSVIRTGLAVGGSVYQVAKQSNGKARICIIRKVGGIGDVLMTLPAVEFLKTTFPDLHITYACDRHTTKQDVYYQLIKNVPFIDEIIDARFVQRNKYDGIIDLSSVCIKYENSNYPLMNRIDIFARACGIPKLRNSVPFYKSTDEEKAKALAFVSELKSKDKKLIFLHTASFDYQRSWPVKNQIELIKLLEEHRPDIQILLSDFNNKIPSEIRQRPNITIATGNSIREAAAYIEKCDLFVGPDSGPMHIAGALRKTSLVLFGSIPPMARINHYKSHIPIIMDKPLPCLGCFYKKCNIDIKCMKDITANKVFAEIKKILG